MKFDLLRKITDPIEEEFNNFEEYFIESLKSEVDLINKKHDLAMQGDSKVIDNLNMNGRNTLKDSTFGSREIESISGTEISRDDFLVNDQGIKIEPFFSRSPANVNLDDNVSLTRHQGGEHARRGRKKLEDMDAVEP